MRVDFASSEELRGHYRAVFARTRVLKVRVLKLERIIETAPAPEPEPAPVPTRIINVPRVGVTTIRMLSSIILQAIAVRLDVPVDMIRGRRRTRRVVTARHLYCYLMYRRLGVQMVHVRRVLDWLDHSTVLHACGKVTTNMAQCVGTAAAVDDVMTLANNAAAEAGIVLNFSQQQPRRRKL